MQKGILTISRNWPSILYSQPLLRSSSATLKTCSTARGIIPAVASVYGHISHDIEQVTQSLTGPPSIVKDFPEPVWPYANTQTLYPSVQLCASCETSSKTSACVDCGSKTWTTSGSVPCPQYVGTHSVKREHPLVLALLPSGTLARRTEDNLLVVHLVREHDLRLRFFPLPVFLLRVRRAIRCSCTIRGCRGDEAPRRDVRGE